MTKLLVGFFLLFSISLQAQKYVDSHNPDEIKSLLGKGNQTSGFGGGDIRITDINDSRSLLVGAYGGIIVNRNYYLGLAGYGLVTNNEFTGLIPTDPEPEEKKLNIYGGYGGLLFGFTLWTKEPVHLNVPILIGAGSLEVVDRNFFNNNYDTDFTIERSAFFVVDPALQLEFNVTEHFRLAAGASYRYVQGLELANIVDEDITGISAIVSLKFGQF